jgi:predicted enzyme related to lactoylglutathione lyase
MQLEHGQLGYLQIPARDITRSARFYTAVFGWQTEPPDSGFEAPGLIGQWIDDRAVTADAGVLLWINVADIDETLTKVASCGGEVFEQPTVDDGVRWLATIGDCAGNPVGIFQLGARSISP